ncbi:DMT family transporter [Candidatus Saccharibacteria bacterium]|nr:DMT family transporter [Candidatus Saccharibacteria bacterium]
MWAVALGLNLLVSTFSSLVKRVYAQTSTAPAAVMMALSHGLGLMPISIVVGLLLPHAISWSTWTVFLLLTEGFLIALFIWFSYVALRLLPAALFQTIFQLRVVVVILLGWTFLAEGLSILQIFGAVLLLASGLLAIWAPARAHKSGKKQYPHFRKGVVFSLVSAFTLGAGLVVEKAALQYMDLGAYFIFGFFTQFAWLAVFATIQAIRRGGVHISMKTTRQATYLGLLSALIGFTYLAALKLADNISLVQALTSMVVPMTAVAAHIFLHEKDDSRLLWTAIVIGLVGFIVVAV